MELVREAGASLDCLRKGMRKANIPDMSQWRTPIEHIFTVSTGKTAHMEHLDGKSCRWADFIDLRLRAMVSAAVLQALMALRRRLRARRWMSASEGKAVVAGRSFHFRF